MNLKRMSYNEAKQLLLQGVCIKLPEWEGYWKFCPDTSHILAHLKNGEVVIASAKYTLHDNWEIATIENCPILRQEIEAKQLVMNEKIVNIKPNTSPENFEMEIKIVSGDKGIVLNYDGLCVVVGNELANSMIENFLLEQAPKESREMVKDLFKILDEFCELAIKDIKKDLNKIKKGR